jgi:AraC-like DNA-binding protein
MTEILTQAFVSSRLKLRVARGNAQDFDLWHWGVSPMFSMDARDRAERPSFVLDATSYQFADVAVASATSSATRFERTTSVIARSGIDTIDVLIYLAGGYALDVEGRAIEVNTGDICILDMTRRCILRTTGYTHLSIVLPRAMLEPLLPSLDILHGLVLPRGTPLNALLVSHLRALYAESPTLGIDEGRAAARGTAALVAAFAGPSANGHKTAAQAVAAASLQAIRRLIEVNIANPELGPDFLSRRAGVSRATLYRLFAPLGGVRNYIQQRRLTRAFQTISDPAFGHERIGSIAQRYGFTNDTVFSRAFRDAYGMSPSDMRNIAKAGYRSAASAQSNGDGAFWTMNRWLLGIDASAGGGPGTR